MALTPAEKQQRYRNKLKARSQASPQVVEAALLAEVERAKRGELSREESIALADKLTGLANRYLWHTHELSKTAMKVRAGYNH
jgi:PleD family two-component response regulator